MGRTAGIKAGTIRGAVGATIVIMIGLLIRDGIEKNKENKELNAEGEAIIKGLEEGIAEYEASDEIVQDADIVELEEDE